MLITGLLWLLMIFTSAPNAVELMRNHLKHCATAAIMAGPEQAEPMYDELIDLMYRQVR